MTIFQSKDGILKTAAVALSGTSATTIVDGGNTGCTVEYVRACEVSGNTPTLILDIYRGGVAYKIRGTLAMTANTPYTDRDAIQLEAGDLLRATASAANQVHVTATYTVPSA
jgi:hypothetical protein